MPSQEPVGRVGGGGVRATVRDIAAETGVSIATVSRVLNQSGSVAPRTRELVEQAVERLGIRAPSPRGGSPKPVGGAVFVRCPYVLTDYFGLIVSSIAETLDRHGRQLVLNAGQGAAVINAGRGLVVYLTLAGQSYELWGTMIDCL